MIWLSRIIDLRSPTPPATLPFVVAAGVSRLRGRRSFQPQISAAIVGVERLRDHHRNVAVDSFGEDILNYRSRVIA